MAPNAAADDNQQPALQLPMLVTSPVDVGRLVREIETIDESLLQLGLRKGGTEVKMPKTSQLMDQTIELNKLNLLQEPDRKRLAAFVHDVKDHAPVLHVSFSADPNTAFVEKLMSWLRREIHPLVLMTIGLQPTIGAGCIIRTTNKHFDFSLRQDFASKTDMLQRALSGKNEESQPVPAVAPETVAANAPAAATAAPVAAEAVPA